MLGNTSYVASIVSLDPQSVKEITDLLQRVDSRDLTVGKMRNLEMPLREHINEPDESTTISDFIAVLNKKV